MNLKNTAQSFLTGVIVFALIGVLLGVLLILLPISFLLNIVFVVMGVVTILYSIPGIAAGLAHIDTRAGRASLTLSLLSLVVGVLLIFWHNNLLMVILGVYFILFPLMEILLSKNKTAQLKSELPKMILGVVLLLVGPAKTLGVLFDIAGWVVIALTVIYSLVTLIGYYGRRSRHKNITGNRVFVDTTGDGKIDTVYMDTNGDGTPDTAQRYRDDK